ncbi:MAG: riboflavin synthase, partial [Candidatus Omnitrophota bacterium]
DKISQDANIGDSIAVNGTCLTIVKRHNNIVSFEIMPQTLRSTNLGSLRIKDKINLERSLKAGDRISGHFVYGHIDCIGVIRRRVFIQDNLCFEIALPIKFVSLVYPKGSIAVDGISLTVQSKKANLFSIYIIPHTHKNTTLGFKHPSDKVNIETDKLGSSLYLRQEYPLG